MLICIHMLIAEFFQCRSSPSFLSVGTVSHKPALVWSYNGRSYTSWHWPGNWLVVFILSGLLLWLGACSLDLCLCRNASSWNGHTSVEWQRYCGLLAIFFSWPGQCRIKKLRPETRVWGILALIYCSPSRATFLVRMLRMTYIMKWITIDWRMAISSDTQTVRYGCYHREPGRNRDPSQNDCSWDAPPRRIKPK
jgi:hypothetical protein